MHCSRRPHVNKLDYSKLTLMDALDLATLIEVEAFKRYTQFAERLGSRYSDDAASVFQSMAVNEKKHGEQLAERRLALFGDERPKVKLDDIFDVEAPDVGAPSQNMSPLKAYRVALSSEKKAFAFYDQALRYVNQPDVKALFEELRDEEAEHVRMIEAIIAKLPPSAKVDVEDEDEDAVPNSEGRNSPLLAGLSGTSTETSTDRAALASGKRRQPARVGREPRFVAAVAHRGSRFGLGGAAVGRMVPMGGKRRTALAPERVTFLDTVRRRSLLSIAALSGRLRMAGRADGTGRKTSKGQGHSKTICRQDLAGG